MAVVMFASIMASSIGLHPYIPYLRSNPHRAFSGAADFLRNLAQTVSNRNFFALFMAGLFAAIGAGVSTNFNAYINTHFWGFTPAQVRDRLVTTCDDVTSVESGAGWDRFTGYGWGDVTTCRLRTHGKEFFTTKADK